MPDTKRTPKLNPVQIFERVEETLSNCHDVEELRPYIEFAYCNYPQYVKHIKRMTEECKDG